MPNNQTLKNGSKLRHLDGSYIEFYYVVDRYNDAYNIVNVDRKRDTGNSVVSHQELGSPEWCLED
jgi:hypothetical protein